MSASPSPVSALPGAADPSMDDILASIRRILNDDEAAAAAAANAPAAPTPPAPAPAEDGVLVLDQSMMVEPAVVAEPAPPPEPVILAATPAPTSRASLLGAESEAAAAASVGSLLRTLTLERNTEVHSGGPTIEDLVREGIRPMLKTWLDVHLPPLVERLVRVEIERLSGRASM